MQMSLWGFAWFARLVEATKQAIDEAIETFLAARKIALHVGVVKSVLRLFDELVKCDEEAVLAEVRKAAEGSEAQT
jgi:hypothetical protein